MKAQMWSLDFIVSMMIFMTVVIALMFFWSYASLQVGEQITLDRLQDTAITVSDLLVRSPGVPEDWTLSTVTIIGLAREEKVLDPGKVYEFTRIPYSTAQKLLRVAPHNFYLEILTPNGSVVTVNNTLVTAGSLPASARTVVPISRFVLLDGEIVRLNLQLWT